MKVSDNFLRSEFACNCGCDFNAVDVTLIKVLEDVRSHFNGNSILITSGNRCPEYNASIPGASPNSKHTKGIAADFKVKNIHADEVAGYLEEKYPNWFGIGRYIGRTHIDVRSRPARWDNR